MKKLLLLLAAILPMMAFAQNEVPDPENRGFGLPTTKKMLAEGMGGSFIIVSGNAFHRHDPHGQQTAELQKKFGWDGTFVLLKIPVALPDGFNYLKYAERL